MKMIHKPFHPPYPGEGQRDDPCWTGNPNVLGHGDNYVCEGQNLTFPGPLLSSKMEKKDLMAFIQKKSQEILLRVEEPEQKEAYFFWQIMELFCNRNGKILMAEMAARLFKGYSCLRRKAPKLVRVKNQDDWCLPLARLLFSAVPDDERRQAVIEMADDLACRGQIFASHICCVVAQLELGSYSDSSFDLIGCDSLPFEKSAIREAIERTEVYEYVLFMTSGFAQPNFQKYKVFHANMLAKESLSALALDYCESIARAVATSPSSITAALTEQIILMSEKLHRGKAEEPEWLLNLRQMHAAKVQQHNKMPPSVLFLCDPEQEEGDDKRPGFPAFQVPSPMQLNTSPVGDVFASRYAVGELLGQGGFGSVYAGVRKADGKMVAIKYVTKSAYDKYITIPGETDSLPLEVALMQIASMPPRCENVVELLEWFEMSSCFVLVLERPSPCMNLHEFCNRENGRLSEPLARDIMWQVVQAARHCCERGVLHRDIKPENLLINSETLQVKLIDFGCGDLLKDSPYTGFAGTPAFWPPEWIQDRQYMGRPATVWSLGVLLFYLVCGDFPFRNEHQTTDADIPLHRYLSGGCQDLISWCLNKDPDYRATLENITNHQWFKEKLQDNVQVRCGRAAGTRRLQLCLCWSSEDR